MEHELSDVSGLHLLTAEEVLGWYAVERILDAEADRIGYRIARLAANIGQRKRRLRNFVIVFM
jgi:hypothetical protein